MGGTMAKVKIIDVARAAGVSLGTVSNALNHPEKVRPETRRLIEETIRELGYTPNQSARMLAGGHNNMIGLVLPQLNHGFCLQIISGAQNEAQKHGYSLIFAVSGRDEDLEEQLLRHFMGTQLAGMLFQPIPRPTWTPRPNPTVPIVYLDAEGPDEGAFVTADNEAQGRLIAEHAASCGARRVAVIGCAHEGVLSRRVTGIRESLSTHPDIELEVLDAGEWDVSGDGFGLGQQLSRRDGAERPDFIIALSDVLATGAIAGIRAAGLSVPEDIRVAGCDGNPLAWSGAVSLTTCAPAGYEMGRKGVQLLVEMIEAEQEPQASHVRLGNRVQSPRTEDHPTRRIETVRPFLLERASTRGAAATTSSAHRSPQVPETNLGAYL